jgi:D-alanine--poly(phosphoribitol) ligase subunit 2
VTDIVREALRQTSSLAVPIGQVSDEDDLFDTGLTSFDLVYLITYLEDVCDIEFSREAMTCDNFSTIARISAAIAAAPRSELAP